MGPFGHSPIPNKVIAVLELLATLIAVKLWIPDSEDRQTSRVALRGFTDNQSNEALVKKAMTTLSQPVLGFSNPKELQQSKALSVP